MRISSAMIVLVLLWIYLSNTNQRQYTPTETNIFMFTSFVALFCLQKKLDQNNAVKRRLASIEWSPTAPLTFEMDPNVPPLPSWVESELPFDRYCANIGGVRVHYIDHGPRDPEAPCVFFIHSIPTWSFTWRKVIASLQSEWACRCIAMDLVGAGLSEKPGFDEHFALKPLSQVRIAITLLKELGPKKIVIVGHGFGGLLAGSIARRMGEQVYGVVLSNVAVQKPRTPQRVLPITTIANWNIVSSACFRWFNGSVAFMSSAAHRATPVSALAQRAFAWASGGTGLWGMTLGGTDHRNLIMVFLRSMPYGDFHPGTLIHHDFMEWSLRTCMRVELVWGTADPLVGRSLRRTEDAFRGTDVQLFRNECPCGHWVPEEDPEAIHEAVCRTIEWMSKTGQLNAAQSPRPIIDEMVGDGAGTMSPGQVETPMDVMD